MSQFLVVQPFEVTDAVLISTDVTEDDYAEWSGIPTYGLANRVITAAIHVVWESVGAGNLNNVPDALSTWWKKVFPTNRWKAFDTYNSSRTAKPGSMTYTLRFGVAVTAFAALNLAGATSVRVRVSDPVYGVVYDKTVDTSPIPMASGLWDWFFGIRGERNNVVLTDLPTFPNADIIVDLVGSSELAVGVLLFGQVVGFGYGIDYGARVGIQDFSRKTRNSFGDADLKVGEFAKRASFNISLPNTELDFVHQYLASLRGTPCLYIGSQLYQATNVFGFFTDFDILISYPGQSDCSVSVEGLT